MSIAGVPRRLAAFAVDLSILAVGIGALQMLLRSALGFSILDLSQSGWTLELISLATVSPVLWGYFYFFEASYLQATPGKLAFRLRVADDDGGRLRPGRVLLRTSVKMMPIEGAFLAFYLPSPWFTAAGRGEFRLGAVFVVGMGLVYLMMSTWNPDRQCTHDLIADSIVLVRDR